MSGNRTSTGNRGQFQKGRSGNPGGRPKAARKAPAVSPFDIVVERTLTVTRNGIPREVAMEEALQHKTYQDAIAGKRMAIREVLKWIDKREQWHAKRTSASGSGPRVVFRGMQQDPANADEAMLILGIAARNPADPDLHEGREQLLLEPWAVNGALRRRRGVTPLSREDLDEIRRCTRASDTLKLPKAGEA